MCAVPEVTVVVSGGHGGHGRAWRCAAAVKCQSVCVSCSLAPSTVAGLDTPHHPLMSHRVTVTMTNPQKDTEDTEKEDRDSCSSQLLLKKPGTTLACCFFPILCFFFLFWFLLQCSQACLNWLSPSCFYQLLLPHWLFPCCWSMPIW